jgi:hypothetical protein
MKPHSTEQSKDEEALLENEVRAIVEHYGINHINPELNEVYSRQMEYVPANTRPKVNMVRVTGRFESESQRLAPWGYGDTFDVEKVPLQLRKLLHKVRLSKIFLICTLPPPPYTVGIATKKTHLRLLTVLLFSHFSSRSKSIHPLISGSLVTSPSILEKRVFFDWTLMWTLSATVSDVRAHLFLGVDEYVIYPS